MSPSFQLGRCLLTEIILLFLFWMCFSGSTAFPSSSSSWIPSGSLASSSSHRCWNSSNNADVVSATTTTATTHVYTARDLQPRYAGPRYDSSMTEEQREIRNAILKSRPRTGLAGPFGPWLAVPEICRHAQNLGRACRYGTSLTFQESELVILLTGAKMKSHAEFDIHVDEAIQAGWTMEQISAIPRDDQFSLRAVQQQLVPRLKNNNNHNNNNDEKEYARIKAIALFTAELLETSTVSEETYHSTKQALGGNDSVLVEITSIVGYYVFVSYTLNVFRIPSK